MKRYVMLRNKQILWIYLFLDCRCPHSFWQVNQCDFIDYDDPVYVTENIHVKAWYYDGGNSVGIHDRLCRKLASP